MLLVPIWTHWKLLWFQIIFLSSISKLTELLTYVKSISVLFNLMSRSIKTFQNLKSWLTIFFQVHQKDAAGFSPFYGIIKCNVSINILQQYIRSSLHTRTKNILRVCNETWKHCWGSYISGPANFPIQKYFKAGVLRQQADCNLKHYKQSKIKQKTHKIKNFWTSERTGFARDSWHCCHPSCPAGLYCTDVWAAHQWVLEPPQFAAQRFKVN